MSGADAEAVQRAMREGLELAGEWGFRVESVGGGESRVRLPYREAMARPGGSVAGPFVMGLADAAMWAALLGETDRALGAYTANLNINFLSPPRGGDLVACAEIVKLGRRLAFFDVRVTSDAGGGGPVAHVTGSYSLPPP